MCNEGKRGIYRVYTHTGPLDKNNHLLDLVYYNLFIFKELVEYACLHQDTLCKIMANIQALLRRVYCPHTCTPIVGRAALPDNCIWFTLVQMTDDRLPIIDRVPAHHNIVFAAGMSGEFQLSMCLY